MTIDKGILIHNIYYMLTYAFGELRQNNFEDIEEEEFENIYDLFAEILYKATTYQLKRGLHKEYVPKSDALATVRGKIEIQQSIALRMQHKLKIQCEFDEFTEDNLHNSIIKTTLDLLLKTGDIKIDRKLRLRRLHLFFSSVSNCDLRTVRWKDIRYDRNTANYRLIHQFCYFIVNGLLLTTETGTHPIQHFDDGMMHRLFEKFVLNYYLRHYPQIEVRASRIEWNIDVHESTLSLLPNMQTDITLRFPKRTLIIDTKYYGKSLQKNQDRTTIRSGNLYQIHSYVLNEDKCLNGRVDGMLLYAKTQEEIAPDGQIALNTGNRILFRNLDLNQKFTNIRNQLDSMIEPYL